MAQVVLRERPSMCYRTGMRMASSRVKCLETSESLTDNYIRPLQALNRSREGESAARALSLFTF
jgi:hypothetical protein